jgi:hypothetical protein
MAWALILLVCMSPGDHPSAGTPNAVADAIERVSAARNIVAHNFFPENVRDLRIKKAGRRAQQTAKSEAAEGRRVIHIDRSHRRGFLKMSLRAFHDRRPNGSCISRLSKWGFLFLALSQSVR